jgi:hypothetical protein
MRHHISEYCNIGGLCVSNGQENATSGCQYCNTSLSREAWSFSPGTFLQVSILYMHFQFPKTFIISVDEKSLHLHNKIMSDTLVFIQHSLTVVKAFIYELYL